MLSQLVLTVRDDVLAKRQLDEGRATATTDEDTPTIIGQVKEAIREALAKPLAKKPTWANITAGQTKTKALTGNTLAAAVAKVVPTR